MEKKKTRLKGQYIRYKQKSLQHNFYANYKESQFLRYTLNTGTHQFYNKFASEHPDHVRATGANVTIKNTLDRLQGLPTLLCPWLSKNWSN